MEHQPETIPGKPLQESTRVEHQPETIPGKPLQRSHRIRETNFYYNTFCLCLERADCQQWEGAGQLSHTSWRRGTPGGDPCSILPGTVASFVL